MLSPRPIATAEARAVAASLGSRAEQVLRSGETARRAGFGAEVTFTAAGADPAVVGKGAIRRSYRRLPNPSRQLLRPFDLQRYDGPPGGHQIARRRSDHVWPWHSTPVTLPK